MGTEISRVVIIFFARDQSGITDICIRIKLIGQPCLLSLASQFLCACMCMCACKSHQ